MHRLYQWLRDHPWIADIPLYAYLLSSPVIQHRPDWEPVWPYALALVVIVLPLLWRRRHPELAALIVFAVAAVQLGMQSYNGVPGDIAMAVMLYTLVVLGKRRAAVVTAVGIVALDFVWAATTLTGKQFGLFATVLAILPLHLAAWALGEFVRSRRGFAAEVERRVLAEDRARIARELHDVLAHSVSVMVLQAEGAKMIARQDPERAAKALETIGSTGRGAVGELRRLLQVLHDAEPQLGVGDLPELVARSGEGRAPVRLEVRGDGDALPASAALQTYRIVQEGLTNVLKHAPPDAETNVLVEFGDEVRIEVVNSGGTGRAPALPSSGRGLAGVAQRVEMFHGTLHTGPTPDGGFRLAATLRAAS
ncbi:signal transduction histidine kinase [Kibdelosporangium banguiense]|uniref:histidine kinase n=1 Tax=Kibdelosporangium banguiense TaxID=1365924 RepID=A0ABS4TTU7_9PSEU|nr:histidine kinase [Kibdelosporangium banguiense]MBP2327841.1 signal transduction histidine kinase [Kibdelosporangium banguiense]